MATGCATLFLRPQPVLAAQGRVGGIATVGAGPNRRLTIHDVARRAGLSPTTVSHVLNHTRFVSEDARARVLAAVEKLHYEPNAAARSLRSRQRGIVGLLITNPHNRSVASVVDGLDAELAQTGYSLIVSITRGDAQKELDGLRLLRRQRVDGLVILGSAGAREDYLQHLHDDGLPMVYINRIDAQLAIDHVALDYASAGRCLAAHLIGLGHRRFALLGMATPKPIAHPFVDSWREALRSAGLSPDATTVSVGVSREEVGYRLAREALLTPNRPSAVVAANTPIATGALIACRELGIAIPRDLSLATLGEAPWVQLFTPPLTAVPDALPEFGHAAAQLLLDRINGSYSGEPRLKTFPAVLIVRGSTGGAPTDDLVAI